MDITMPEYIQACLHKFKHAKPRRPQDAPHPSPPPQFGVAAQLLAQPDETNKLDAEGQTRLQQIGALSYSMQEPWIIPF